MKHDDDQIDLTLSRIPKHVPFVCLRKDLHPVVPTIYTKKRKLEATIDLVKMAN